MHFYITLWFKRSDGWIDSDRDPLAKNSAVLCVGFDFCCFATLLLFSEFVMPRIGENENETRKTIYNICATTVLERRQWVELMLLFVIEGELLCPNTSYIITLTVGCHFI